MWPFDKYTTLERSGVFGGFTDWHSHILPGVDDGVKNIDESLSILNLYEQLGIGCVWLTPHVMSDIPNSTARLRQRFEELQNAYSGPVKLHLAAEYMLDSLFEERLMAGDVLTLGPDGNQLLVETSYFNPPMGFRKTLAGIKSAGYYPVLAHPERYVYMDMQDYRQLKESQVRFQLDLFAIFGVYGTDAKKKSEKLLREDMYDMAGTDVHRLMLLKETKDMKLNAKIPDLIISNITKSKGL